MSHAPFRSVSSAVVLAVAIVLSFAGPSLAEVPEPARYERTAYDGTIWKVQGNSVEPLSWTQWTALGRPAYATAVSSYQKVSFLPTVYGVTTFEMEQPYTVVAPITAAQYRAVGAPRIAVVPWVKGLYVFQWDKSNEIFVEDVNLTVRRLTFAQWAAAGSPRPEIKSNTGFVRMSWDGSGAIAYMCDLAAGRGGRVTYAQWTALGSPTPRAVNRVPNDIVFSGWSLDPSGIEYMGPITLDVPGYSDPLPHWVQLTFPEWTRMGAPKPVVTDTIYPELSWCPRNVPTPANLTGWY